MTTYGVLSAYLLAFVVFWCWVVLGEDWRKRRAFQRTARHAARGRHPSDTPYDQVAVEIRDLDALFRAPSAKREARP